MSTRLQLVTADSTYPVTLEEVKDHLGIDLPDDDLRIEGYIAAATEWVERSVRGGIAARTQTWDRFMSGFPGGSGGRGRITLPKPPLQSVTYLKYLNTSSVLTTLTADTDYKVYLDHRGPGFIEPMPSTYWPSVADEREDAVEIRFIAGHATNALIPANIKQAMLMMIAHWNENREAVVTGTITSEVPLGAQNLIAMSEWGNYG